MIKKSLIPIIVLFSVAVGFFMGYTIYKSDNIFYSQNKDFIKLKTLIKIVENNYSDKIKVFDFLRKKLIEEVSIIDPYSSFYDEDEYEKFRNKIKGEFTGIGIKYITINDTIRILDVIENSPAEKSGLKKLDAIIALNGQDITSISLDSIVNLFTDIDKIDLTVIDFITNKEKKIKLEKEIIQINPITYFYLDSNIAYIKINSFQKNTYDFFKTAQKELLKNHSILKVILDLRSNGGGMLKSAVNIVDEFMEKGDTIVSTQSNGKSNNIYISTKKGDFKTVELIILVNRSTASAAELVTLAFQDNDRSLIVGTRTFGKGVFQQDLPVLKNSIAHITTGRYFGSSG
ncbi:MAG: S41 family peptidase, partial [Bacteroidota bacterium]|nr:S41 family peptidase [Bacteroidota bacterium]